MSSLNFPAVSASNLAAQAAAAQNPHLRKIRDLIYQVAGILQPDHKLQFLEDRCGRRLQHLRLASLREYYDCLTLSSARNEEMKELLNEITIGETCFFRNAPQLDALRTVVLPAILKNKSHLAYRHLRFWSAGCSTGEEAYTLAILLLQEREGALKNVNFEVLATDLNARSLEAAQAAVYGEYALRNLGPFLRQKYFVPAGEKLAVRPEVKSLVKFSRLNLVDDSRMTFMKGMDVIFCCNVMIYFDAAVRKRIVQHFYNNLVPNSYLFVGHAESLYGINNEFHLVHFPGATAYLKAEKRIGGGV
jgi:chemotaxis protein methyltransferase CheR